MKKENKVIKYSIIGLMFLTIFIIGLAIGDLKGSVQTYLAINDDFQKLSIEKCEELNYYETFTSVEPGQVKHYQEERVEVMTKEFVGPPNQIN